MRFLWKKIKSTRFFKTVKKIGLIRVARSVFNFLMTTVHIFFQMGSMVLFIFFVLPLLWLAESIQPVRIGRLIQCRIGELASGTDIFLRRMQSQKFSNQPIYIFSAGARPKANTQLLIMIKRVIRVVDYVWFDKWLEAVMPLLNKTRFYQATNTVGNEVDAYMQSHPTLQFTREEEDFGWSELLKLGIKRTDWFVCFYARDSEYLAQQFGCAKKDWAYHDHRDADIESYVPAMQYITTQNGYALRMGAIVQKPLTVQSNPRIIDYASNYRTDFLDVFLAAKCKFFVGSPAGIISVSVMFGVKILSTNHIPFGYTCQGSEVVILPKKYKNKLSEAWVSYSKIIRIGLAEANFKKRYDEANLEVVNNSSQEITDAVIEMNDVLNGTTEYSSKISKNFRELFRPQDLSFRTTATVPSSFYFNNKYLFLNENEL